MEATRQRPALPGYDAARRREDRRAERIARGGGDARSAEQLREHYQVERELAERLMRAPAPERRGLYSEVYDELFRRLPHHPQLRDIENPADRQREIEHRIHFLSRFFTPASVFMEIGPGDCALSMRAASIVQWVYAVDVSEQITRVVQPPRNFQLVLSDGCSIDVPAGGVDVAFSDQLMEHLHPDDAQEQLRNIYRALAPAGVYACFTPNRLYGPHDVSAYFSDVASGFHLREYTGRELKRLFISAGFSEVRVYAMARGHCARFPYSALLLLESAIETLPRVLARPVAHFAPIRAVLGLQVVAVKPR
jgi:SAM-dependent methyltransferase